MLENPLDVGVLTVREIANAANVNPNTVVRMARQIGFTGYDEFRAPFRDAIRNGTAGFPDRVRWLQDTRKSGTMGALYADMVQSALANIEQTFADIQIDQLIPAATAVWQSRNVFTLGVCLLYTSPSPRDYAASRMPSSA